MCISWTGNSIVIVLDLVLRKQSALFVHAWLVLQLFSTSTVSLVLHNSTFSRPSQDKSLSPPPPPPSLPLSLPLSLCILGIIIKKIFLSYRLLELSHIYKFHVLNLMEVLLMDCTISRWGVRRTQQHAFEDPHLLTLKNNDNPQSSSMTLESKSRRFVGWKGDRLWVNFNSMHLHHVYAPL